MNLKKLFNTILLLLLSIPAIITTLLLFDLAKNHPQAIASPRLHKFLILLFSMIIVTTIILLFLFIKLLIFFSSIQKKTTKLSKGELKETVITPADKLYMKISETNQILQNLEAMRISLIEAQNQTTKFIMGISHDIRTPLAIIKGYTEALSDNILSSPEEKKNALNLISEKTQQLEGITESLIDFMRMEKKELREHFEPINVYEFLNYFAKSCTLTLSLYNRNFSYNINIPENYCTKANRTLSLRALDNLFSNAIRYTNDGDSICLNAELTDQGIIIKLSDTGIGIDKKELDYIFNIFYRGSNATYENGLGVGLAVVQNITQTHGWKINCESEKDQGTCFTITIPLESCSET